METFLFDAVKACDDDILRNTITSVRQNSAYGYCHAVICTYYGIGQRHTAVEKFIYSFTGGSVPEIAVCKALFFKWNAAFRQHTLVYFDTLIGKRIALCSCDHVYAPAFMIHGKVADYLLKGVRIIVKHIAAAVHALIHGYNGHISPECFGYDALNSVAVLKSLAHYYNCRYSVIGGKIEYCGAASGIVVIVIKVTQGRKHLCFHAVTVQLRADVNGIFINALFTDTCRTDSHIYSFFGHDRFHLR